MPKLGFSSITVSDLFKSKVRNHRDNLMRDYKLDISLQDCIVLASPKVILERAGLKRKEGEK